MIKKIKNLKKTYKNFQGGMTYIELIVVLTIFGIMSSVLIFNYSTFTNQVDLQNLSQDIALQIVSAQKASLSGKIPGLGEAGTDIISANISNGVEWKPAYGVYFNADPTISSVYNNKKLVSYIDTENLKYYGETCPDPIHPGGTSDQCRDVINIQNGDYVKNVCTVAVGETDCVGAKFLHLTFTRPDSGAFIVDNRNFVEGSISPYPETKAIITIGSERDASLQKDITVYSSGRIEVN
ncbi:MAG: type II secretion system protein [Candidatus Nomurabacteria bacterium]|nr:type II secretion system protein [Candidatus Nomurabacteria bacterium]